MQTDRKGEKKIINMDCLKCLNISRNRTRPRHEPHKYKPVDKWDAIASNKSESKRPIRVRDDLCTDLFLKELLIVASKLLDKYFIDYWILISPVPFWGHGSHGSPQAFPEVQQQTAR